MKQVFTSLVCVIVVCLSSPAFGKNQNVTVGSKSFTESVVLGELVSHLARSADGSAIHRQAMGGTRVLWNALNNGDIDIYPEYTGTITQEILSGQKITGMKDIRQAIAAHGLRMSRPLGFNNTYAIGMKEPRANELGITTVSDLRTHPDLRFGFSNEFMDRGDGWPSLRNTYALPQQHVNGLEHDLAYRGLESGSIDAIDLYMTDADIQYYQLRVLEDDLSHFPEYDAVLLYREDLERRAPRVISAIRILEGNISETEMRAMNAQVKIERNTETRTAADFLKTKLGLTVQYSEESIADRVFRTTREHIVLVMISLSAAILIALPLGIIAVRLPRLGHVILGMVGVVQTIPALALLVFMIPLLGIGVPAAIAALFLYSLLPIVRNTYTGLHDIPHPLRESAEALGLPPHVRLRRIELPLASRSILAGIKTSAVINVGFATLGAFIAAGGYGESILTGIRLDDMSLILQGAIPAALLALAVQGLFELMERVVVPRGLRLTA
ncbi:MAG TPA: ABC transporter permease subunit [Nitrospirales bacterium]|nr:ABC transporter permease subunit [Nitrospirales bacterium]HIN33012.1 ABC transporter permease subunit [Nitrospirales bacterium]